MKRLLITLTVGIFTIGCSSDQSICKCIELGNEVNQLSASFFDREYSVLGKDSLDALIQQRDEWCAPFKGLSGELMLEKLEECEDLGEKTLD
jgi:hypothetical protein